MRGTRWWNEGMHAACSRDETEFMCLIQIAIAPQFPPNTRGCISWQHGQRAEIEDESYHVGGSYLLVSSQQAKHLSSAASSASCDTFSNSAPAAKGGASKRRVLAQHLLA